MKEFIDKLIERLEEKAFIDYDEYYTDGGECLISISDVKEIVNELAEEYSKDYCEWKWGIDYAEVQCKGDKILFGTRRIFTYCPYCGKKIKDAPYTEGE